jgi:hypothetical protein
MIQTHLYKTMPLISLDNTLQELLKRNHKYKKPKRLEFLEYSKPFEDTNDKMDQQVSRNDDVGVELLRFYQTKLVHSLFKSLCFSSSFSRMDKTMPVDIPRFVFKKIFDSCSTAKTGYRERKGIVKFIDCLEKFVQVLNIHPPIKVKGQLSVILAFPIFAVFNDKKSHAFFRFKSKVYNKVQGGYQEIIIRKKRSRTPAKNKLIAQQRMIFQNQVLKAVVNEQKLRCNINK